MPCGDLDYLIEDDPDPEHVRQLISGLVAFNDGRAELENRRPIAVFVRRDEEVLGGVDGYTHWRWLYVSHLWVHDDVRDEGVGSHLMSTIETQARLRGCRGAWLDTFSFQAPGFYESIGYQSFGELPEFPPGSRRHFLWKPLEGPQFRLTRLWPPSPRSRLMWDILGAVNLLLG